MIFRHATTRIPMIISPIHINLHQHCLSSSLCCTSKVLRSISALQRKIGFCSLEVIYNHTVHFVDRGTRLLPVSAAVDRLADHRNFTIQTDESEIVICPEKACLTYKTVSQCLRKRLIKIHGRNLFQGQICSCYTLILSTVELQRNLIVRYGLEILKVIASSHV